MILSDILDISSRVETPDGFMRVKAAITRVGVLTYDASLLGLGRAGEMVRVRQTAESVFHPETLASARGLPVTLDHPQAGDVTPETYRWLNVGNVMDMPKQMPDGRLGAELFIGDKGAIEALDQGTRQISVGKTMTLIPAEDDESDYLTDGPIVFNHVALVGRGRAGSEVQVFDQTQEDEMKLEELPAAVAKAVTDSLAGNPAGASVSTTDVAAAVKSALAPLAAEVKGIVDTQTATAKAVKDAEFAATQKKESDKLIADTRAEERSRFEVMALAMPFIAADKVAGLKDASVKDILVAAIGDSVPNAATASVDYLRGALETQARHRQITHRAGDPPAGSPPAGYATGAQDASNKSQDAYLENLRNAHKRIYSDGKKE